jgi:hypothetical protein
MTKNRYNVLMRRAKRGIRSPDPEPNEAPPPLPQNAPVCQQIENSSLREDFPDIAYDEWDWDSDE